MTRQELRRILEPGYPFGGTPHRDLEFCIDLAYRHGWTVERAGRNGFCARVAASTIEALPVDSDEAVATFAHECGHLTDRVVRPQIREGEYRISIAGEVAAWRYALDTLGWRWSTVMHQHLARCLWSYREGGFYVQHPSERVLFDELIEHSLELSRHVVRIAPMSRGTR